MRKKLPAPSPLFSLSLSLSSLFPPINIIFVSAVARPKKKEIVGLEASCPQAAKPEGSVVDNFYNFSLSFLASHLPCRSYPLSLNCSTNNPTVLDLFPAN